MNMSWQIPPCVELAVYMEDGHVSCITFYASGNFLHCCNIFSLILQTVLHSDGEKSIVREKGEVVAETNIMVGHRSKSKHKCHVTEHVASPSDEMAGRKCPLTRTT